MKDWLLFSSMVVVLWGMWGLFAKMAARYVSPQSLFLSFVLGVLLVGLCALLIGFRPQLHPRGMVLGVLAGVALALGDILLFFAIARGKVSVVVTMTALYPLVTIVLAFLVLRESITLTQGAGMLLALVAMALLAA